MPVLKQKFFDVVRGLRAFLSPDRARVETSAAGVRADDSDVRGPSEEGRDQSQKLRQAEQQLEKQQEQIKRQNQELKELRAKVVESVHGTEHYGVRPENVVWILGTARSGSTWLASIMEEQESYTVWREPYVGELFGRLYYSWVGEKHFQTKHFILGERYKQSWLKSIRSFVLNEATVRFPAVSDEHYLVIREPNGSIGAPLLLEATPESRMIFLIRDPRDVVASSMDAYRKGSWLYERRVEQGGGRTAMFDMQADALVEMLANTYLQNVGNVREAYEAHKGPKVLVRYEEMRADTLGTMKHIYSSLGIPVDKAELEQAVNKHAWERVPEEEKGEGKFYRKGKPGGWREDLTPEQAGAIERITAPLFNEFYPYEG